MKVEAAYLVGTHPDMFQAGKPARILGVETVSPGNGKLEPRVCYHLLFANGEEDWIPLSESANFKIISKHEFDRGEFPPVTN